jgi:hypothetical protein
VKGRGGEGKMVFKRAIVFTKRNKKDIILQASITKWNSLTGGPVSQRREW